MQRIALALVALGLLAVLALAPHHADAACNLIPGTALTYDAWRHQSPVRGARRAARDPAAPLRLRLRRLPAEWRRPRRHRRLQGAERHQPRGGPDDGLHRRRRRRVCRDAGGGLRRLSGERRRRHDRRRRSRRSTAALPVPADRRGARPRRRRAAGSPSANDRRLAPKRAASLPARERPRAPARAGSAPASMGSTSTTAPAARRYGTTSSDTSPRCPPRTTTRPTASRGRRPVRRWRPSCGARSTPTGIS